MGERRRCGAVQPPDDTASCQCRKHGQGIAQNRLPQMPKSDRGQQRRLQAGEHTKRDCEWSEPSDTAYASSAGCWWFPNNERLCSSSSYGELVIVEVTGDRYQTSATNNKISPF